MTFHVYNSLTKQKEPFQSLEPGVVRMYNCGPTVYKRQHIGNFRAFLFADLLRRWLEYRGNEVQQVMNITDVGHLTDDGDEGEDKLEAESRETGKDPWAISREQTELFLADLRQLGVLEPKARPRATEHIPEMVEIIEALLEKGHAYRVGGDVYFEVSTFERYGRLSGNRIEDLDAGARIEVRDEKRHPADFALWKEDPHHIMKWETVFGPDGFPGWHIECSAMARKHLGDRIDIHTGGEDNIFPHHECEIAQTEAFTGEPFATYWMHTKFLQVDGGKMAKSLGNVYTVDDVLERGFQARHLRLALLRGHYRQPLNFSWDIMKEVVALLDNLDDTVVRLRRVVAGEAGAAEPAAGLELCGQAAQGFEEALDDDLNMPRALAALSSLRPALLEDALGKEAAEKALAFLERANGVLNVVDLEEQSLDEEVEGLIAARKQAKEDRDWAEADRIRDRIAELGIELQDTPTGTTWRRK